MLGVEVGLHRVVVVPVEHNILRIPFGIPMSRAADIDDARVISLLENIKQQSGKGEMS